MKGDDLADRLVNFAVHVTRLVDSLPASASTRHIADQLFRAATSAGANYEEARGAESRRDFVHKLGVSLKEMQESYYWLRLAAGLQIVDADLSVLAEEARALCRILGKSRITAGAVIEIRH
jgi:four helix bundle protein